MCRPWLTGNSLTYCSQSWNGSPRCDDRHNVGETESLPPHWQPSPEKQASQVWESGILNLRGCWIRRWSESGLNETPRGPVGPRFPAPHQQKGLLQVDILLAMIQGLWGGRIDSRARFSKPSSTSIVCLSQPRQESSGVFRSPCLSVPVSVSFVWTVGPINVCSCLKNRACQSCSSMESRWALGWRVGWGHMEGQGLWFVSEGHTACSSPV